MKTFVVALLLVLIAFLSSLVFFHDQPTAQSSPDVDGQARGAGCATLTQRTERYKCWELKLDDIAHKQGIDAAFDFLNNASTASKEFAADCHAFSHRVGYLAFEKYKQTKQSPLTAKGAYCAFGYYHGFMEAVLNAGQDIAIAKEFCGGDTMQDRSVTLGTKLACYHGIGHGLTDPHDNRYWGNAQALIENPLKICKQVASTEQQLYYCSSGVYNALEILISKKDYGLTRDPNDPLAFCWQQETVFQKACAVQKVSSIMRLTNGDIPQAINYVAKAISDDKIAFLTTRTIAQQYIERHGAQVQNVEGDIAMCRTVAQRLRESCLNGFVFGLQFYGRPQHEYVETIKFCGSQQLNNQERQACYSYIGDMFTWWYTQDTLKQICQEFPDAYRSSCKATVPTNV